MDNADDDCEEKECGETLCEIEKAVAVIDIIVVLLVRDRKA